jgi:hypothetical protein
VEKEPPVHQELLGEQHALESAAHSPRRLHAVLGNSGENRMNIWTHIPLKPNLRIMSNLHFAIFDSV